MKARLLAVLLAAAPAGARATSPNAGTSGAPFLTLGADARAAAMGGAVSAAADDAAGVYWNPACLARLRYRHATFTHAASYQSTFSDFLAYAQPIEAARGRGREEDLSPEQLGTIAGAFLYQNSGKIAEVDNAGNATGGAFTPQDFAAMLGWGSTLGRSLDVGVSAKYVSSKIQASAQTGAADLGARWRTDVPGTEAAYSLSATVRNIGGRLSFRSASDPLPLTVVIGQALRPLRALVIDVDVTAPRDGAVYPAIGAEWRAEGPESITGALRLGWSGRLKASDVGGAAGVSLGGGLAFRRVAFDYSWSPAGELGSVSRLSISYLF